MSSWIVEDGSIVLSSLTLITVSPEGAIASTTSAGAILEGGTMRRGRGRRGVTVNPLRASKREMASYPTGTHSSMCGY